MVHLAENGELPVFSSLFTKKPVSLCCTYFQISTANNRSLEYLHPGHNLLWYRRERGTPRRPGSTGVSVSRRRSKTRTRTESQRRQGHIFSQKLIFILPHPEMFFEGTMLKGSFYYYYCSIIFKPKFVDVALVKNMELL